MLVGALRFDGVVRLDQAIPSVSVARTDDTGVFQVKGLKSGQYVVVANRPNGTIGTPTHKPDSVTYFPGVLDLQSAQLLTLGPGATVRGLDFPMLSAPTFEVSGVAADEAGRRVAGALVTLEADWPILGGLRGAIVTDDVGQFRIPLIAAGEYRLTVKAPEVDAKRTTRQGPFVRVRVDNADVSDLVIRVPAR
jgi:hypothetical protein